MNSLWFLSVLGIVGLNGIQSCLISKEVFSFIFYFFMAGVLGLCLCTFGGWGGGG